jgi:hypothetical protein
VTGILKWGSPRNYIIFDGDSHIPIVKCKIFQRVMLEFDKVKPNARIVSNKFYV